MSATPATSADPVTNGGSGPASAGGISPSERGYQGRARASANGEVAGELLEVSMGPQHPSTHGVFRMDVTLDGERVVKLKPVFGYLHRNHEQIAQGARYLSAMPYTDRLDYF